jgi:Glyoxalase/Bleomycin resistance protein/Dioxygenase superfamily
MDLGRFRIGLRVDDVIRAADFYRGLGFTDVGSVPGSEDIPVMVMLQREGAMLIVDALVGMPFAPTRREAMIQAGPRGLGVAIGLGVDDLETAYRWCREAGCEITAEPRDEPSEDPMRIAGVSWAATHGAVSLELAGCEGAVDAERRFDDLCTAAAAWFMSTHQA